MEDDMRLGWCHRLFVYSIRMTIVGFAYEDPLTIKGKKGWNTFISLIFFATVSFITTKTHFT